MLAWRLCREGFADLAGEGARQYGGRWNSPGRPMVYAASEPALAVLEVRVHLDVPPALIPDDYVLLAIDLGDAAIEALEDIPAEPAAFGDQWLEDRRTPILATPSVIVPEGRNLLLNPLHAAASGFAIVRERHFEFDRRLWHV